MRDVYDKDDVITKRDDELTPDDFRDDGYDEPGGGGGGWCFLTTAVVELRGEADNGPTLTTLRNFPRRLAGRDGRGQGADRRLLRPCAQDRFRHSRGPL